MATGARKPHIAVLPTPGMGHLFPLAELAKLLVHRHNFTVTFITFAASDNAATKSFLSTLPSSITFLSLPPVSLDDVPSDAAIETRLSIATIRSLPSLRSVLLDLRSTTNLVAFLADFFACDGFHIARDLGIPYYMFIPTNLQFLTLMLELPALDAAVKSEFPELKEPVKLPGCVPIPGSQLITPLLVRSNEAYKWMLHHAALYRQAQGILVNSFAAIEPAQAKLLAEEESGRPPVYPVGPMIQARSAAVGADGAACLRWLEEQPPESVIFVSFGSGGTLSKKQMGELAMGLEASGQRFLWVVRSPCDKDSSSTYFTARSADDPLSWLPEGFLERTKEVGMVVPSWAPQIDVLAKPATGGFLSHCGWNSTLESVAHGVPMIAWPLFAEQRMNSIMLVEAVRIAIRPAATGVDGVFGREEIAEVVKELMEGEEGKAVRSRAKELKEKAAAAIREEGSSFTALNEIAGKWKSFSPA